MSDDLQAQMRTLTQAVNELIVEVRSLLGAVVVDDQPDAEDDDEGDQPPLIPMAEVEAAQRRVKEITDQSRAVADYRPAGSYDPRYLEAKRQATVRKTEALLNYHEARSRVLTVIQKAHPSRVTNPELRDAVTAPQARILGRVLGDLVEDGVLVMEPVRDGNLGRPRHTYRIAKGRR